jgi:hypothetical protein
VNLNSESGFFVIVMLVYIPQKIDLKKLHHYEGLAQRSMAVQYVMLQLFPILEVYVVRVVVLLMLVCIKCLVMPSVTNKST